MLLKKVKDFKESYIIKLSIMMTTVIVIMISLFGVLSYMIFSSHFNKEILFFNTRVLDYVQRTIEDTIFEKVESAAISAVMKDNSWDDILFFIDNPLVSNHAKIIDIQQSLADIENSLDGICNSVEIYYKENNFVLSVPYGITFLNADKYNPVVDCAWIAAFEAQNKSRLWINNYKNSNFDTKGKGKNILTFVKSIPITSNGSKFEGAIAISITEDRLQKKINEIDYDFLSNFFIADRDGNIISSEEKSALNGNIADESYFQKIISAPGTNFIEELHGSETVFASAKSELNDWYYIYAVEASEYYEKSFAIRDIVFWVCIGTILLTLVIASSLGSKLSNPLKKILITAKSIFTDQNEAAVKNYNDIKMLDQTLKFLNGRVTALNFELNNSKNMIGNTFYQNLLNGNVTDKKEIEEQLDFIGHEFVHPYYNCLLICPDVKRIYSMDVQDRENLFYSIMASASEYKEFFVPIILDKSRIALLCNSEGSNDSYQEIALLISNFVKERFEIELYFGLAEATDDLAKVNICLTQAGQAVAYSAIFPNSFFFEYSRYIPFDIYGTAELDLLFQEVLSYVSDGKEEKMSAIFEQIRIKLWESCSLKALWYMTEKLPDMLYHFLLNLHIKSQEVAFENFEQRLCLAYYIDDVVYCIRDYMIEVMVYVKSRYSSSNQQYVDKAKEYIEKNFASHELSLEAVADYLHISSAHCSRVFKETTNQNFSEYVTCVRMREAQRLLVSGNKSIKGIAEELGFNDYNYFSKKFKSHFGVTPGQYKKSYFE